MDQSSQVRMLVQALTKSGSGRSMSAPLAVFCIMAWERAWHPDWWSVDELMRAAGCGKEGVVEARKKLVALGVACEGPGGRGLRLTDAIVHQLRLMPPETVSPGRQVGSTDPSASTTTTTTTTTTGTGSTKQKKQLEPQTKSDQPTEQAFDSLPHPDQADVLEALSEAGVGPPTCYKLAADPWMTAERVRNTAAAKRREGKGVWAIVLDLRGHVEHDDPEGRDVGREWLRFLERRGGKR